MVLSVSMPPAFVIAVSRVGHRRLSAHVGLRSLHVSMALACWRTLRRRSIRHWWNVCHVSCVTLLSLHCIVDLHMLMTCVFVAGVSSSPSTGNCGLADWPLLSCLAVACDDLSELSISWIASLYHSR